MLVLTEIRPLGPAELAFRKRALRDAIICIAWLKVLSILFYALLLLLTIKHSKGMMSNLICIMIYIVVPAQIINAVFLFLGALQQKITALEIGLWLIIIIAAYNTLLGTIGGIYFIRTGYLTLHFFTSTLFALLACSIVCVMCHDIIVIYTFQNVIKGRAEPNHPESPSEHSSSVDSPPPEKLNPPPTEVH